GVHGDGERLGGRQAGVEGAVDEQAPDVAEGDLAHQVLDVDAPVPESAALRVRVGGHRVERDGSFEAGHADGGEAAPPDGGEGGADGGRPGAPGGGGDGGGGRVGVGGGGGPRGGRGREGGGGRVGGVGAARAGVGSRRLGGASGGSTVLAGGGLAVRDVTPVMPGRRPANRVGASTISLSASFGEPSRHSVPPGARSVTGVTSVARLRACGRMTT